MSKNSNLLHKYVQKFIFTARIIFSLTFMDFRYSQLDMFSIFLQVQKTFHCAECEFIQRISRLTATFTRVHTKSDFLPFFNRFWVIIFHFSTGSERKSFAQPASNLWKNLLFHKSYAKIWSIWICTAIFGALFIVIIIVASLTLNDNAMRCQPLK